MDELPDQPSLAAEALRRDAHAMRNDIATLRSIVQLLDDGEIREAVAASTSGLQRSVERAVAAARIDGWSREEPAPLDLATLLELAVRRARRELPEGAAPAVDLSLDPLDVLVVAPACERLLTDVVELVGDARWSASVDERHVVLEVDVDEPALQSLAGYLAALAAAGGCSVEVSGAGIRLRFLRSVA